MSTNQKERKIGDFRKRINKPFCIGISLEAEPLLWQIESVKTGFTLVNRSNFLLCGVSAKGCLMKKTAMSAQGLRQELTSGHTSHLTKRTTGHSVRSKNHRVKHHHLEGTSTAPSSTNTDSEIFLVVPHTEGLKPGICPPEVLKH